MARVSRDQLSFSSGEVSPLLYGRPDYQRYQTGLKSCIGFLPLRQGGVTRTPGTIFRGYTRNNAKARLIAFEFAENDSLTLELTPGWMRVWRYGQLVQAAGGGVYELAHPYTAEDLDTLQWVQSADVIYLAGGEKPVQRLARRALNSWSIGAAEFRNGPFRNQNLDEGRILKASSSVGVTELTANGPFFRNDHVGGLIKLAAQNFGTTPLWTGNTDINVGERMRYDARAYELVEGTNTGVNPPVHTEGVEQVGLRPAVSWRYVSDDVGIVRITEVLNETKALAEVVRTLPGTVVTDGTYRWSEGAWSRVYGYPACLEIHDQRLVAAGAPTEPRTLWFSVLGDYLDFKDGTDADSAFSYTIAGGSSQNRVIWLKTGRSGLHIGALGEEYSARAERSEAMNATNAFFGLDSSIGSKEGVRPIAPDSRPIFISKDGARVVEIAYDLQSDANKVVELSLPSEHLGAAGFEEIVWQSAPLRFAWLRTGDGRLVAMVYDPSEDVLGWAQCPVAGGKVEALAVATDPTGNTDTLTMVTRRVINGETVRMIEEQAQNWGVVSGSADLADAIHLFASKVVTGAGLSNFSVPHLVGQTVNVWTDAGEFGPITVPADGAVTIPAAVNRAVIGLLDADSMVETLPLQPVANDGAARARRKRLGPQSGITLHRTAAMRGAAVEHDLGQVERQWPAVNLLPRPVAADLSTAFSGTVRAQLTSGWAQDVTLRFWPVGGAPATLLAITPVLQEGGL